MSRATIVAVALAFAAVTPARAAGLVVLAAPGSFRAGWATPAVLARPGDSLTLVNADAALHSIRSDAVGSDDRSWCGPLNPGPESPTNPRRFALGRCPLFWSDVALALGNTREVLGLDALEPGRAYPFRCEIFPDMKAVLVTP